MPKKGERSRTSKKREVSEVSERRASRVSQVAPHEREKGEEGGGAGQEVSLSEQQEQPAAEVAPKSDGEMQQEAAELVKVPAAELEQLKTEKEEYYDRLLRLTAEFENYKKRIQKEFDGFRKYAAENVILELLPILDNLERALGSVPEGVNDGFREGIEIIHRQLCDTLAKVGLSPMETVGREFDPNLHEALMPIQSEDCDEGTVVEEFQKGYTLFDKVIRHAKVSVSAGKGTEEERGGAADGAENGQDDQQRQRSD